MVEIIKRYRERPDVQELLIFIDNKVKGERRWWYFIAFI